MTAACSGRVRRLPDEHAAWQILPPGEGHQIGPLTGHDDLHDPAREQISCSHEAGHSRRRRHDGRRAGPHEARCGHRQVISSEHRAEPGERPCCDRAGGRGDAVVQLPRPHHELLGVGAGREEAA